MFIISSDIASIKSSFVPKAGTLVYSLHPLSVANILYSMSSSTKVSECSDTKAIGTNTICYPIDKNFINAHTNEISKKIKNLNNFKLIFSAHGLPKKNIKKGDPYQWQVEQSVNKIVKNLNYNNLDWVLSYQSRVGPLKWIEPSTDDVIIENSKIGKHIVLVPIAFVSEHSETLVELDIEYKKLATDNGCNEYTRVPALGTNEDFILAMSELIINKDTYKISENFYPPKIQCPSNFKKCHCLN